MRSRAVERSDERLIPHHWRRNLGDCFLAFLILQQLGGALAHPHLHLFGSDLIADSRAHGTDCVAFACIDPSELEKPNRVHHHVLMHNGGDHVPNALFNREHHKSTVNARQAYMCIMCLRICAQANL